jgi:hypothetical protein
MAFYIQNGVHDICHVASLDTKPALSSVSLSDICKLTWIGKLCSIFDRRASVIAYYIHVAVAVTSRREMLGFAPFPYKNNNIVSSDTNPKPKRFESCKRALRFDHRLPSRRYRRPCIVQPCVKSGHMLCVPDIRCSLSNFKPVQLGSLLKTRRNHGRWNLNPTHSRWSKPAKCLT